jgi:hypothetical protein
VRFYLIRSTVIISLLSILTVLPLGATSYAQGLTRDDLAIPDSDKVQILTTQDGSTLRGRIIEIRDEEIVFQSDMGETTIQISKIKNVEEVPASRIRKGEYWFDNPNTTRLYFSPTGRMLKQGDGYFADYMVFFPSVAYGITDNINIGGGVTIVPGIDFDDQVFYFTPKIGLSTSSKTSIAAGALILALPEIDNESPIVGILYGVGTFGESDASITAGLGYGFVEDEIADKPLVMVGGEKRISRRISLVSENWIFPGVDDPVISYGFRFFGEDISVDLALFNILGDDAFFPGFPWVDFVFNF